MTTRPFIYIGNEAVPELIHYCARLARWEFLLVADSNTYAALGRDLETALRAQGGDVVSVVLTGDQVIADEYYLVQVLLRADETRRLYLAVGSGTITDITRFVSYKARESFISVPTAASVDGFTSIGAPLVVGGLKRTVNCQPPIAIFADLGVLAAAPRRLRAAGFGDMVGKLTSTADWRLGHILMDEPYDEQIAQRAAAAARSCVDHVAEIASGSERSLRILMESLVDSGLCMLEFGNSSPASGAEHHFSHYWEMKLLRENRPAVLHGAKVGVGTVLSAQLYERLRQMSRQQVAARLQGARAFDRTARLQGIQEAYGPLAQEVIARQSAFLEMTDEQYDALEQRIWTRWDEIQEVAATVPPADQIVAWLREVGSPADGVSLSLRDDDLTLALKYAHYLRNRFTIARLASLLGW